MRWQPAADPPTLEFDTELAAALLALSPRHRSALWLRYGEDLTIEQTARVMHTGQPAMKQLLLRARAKLRDQLDERQKQP